MNLLTKVYEISGIEMFVWIAAIVFLAIWNPDLSGGFTICPHRLLGLGDCPGCGLGRAVSLILHGELESSLRAHVFGIPALVVLGIRTATILRTSIRNIHEHQEQRRI